MIKVLFICHGNICRSPMAEALFNNHVNKLGLKNDMYSISAATSTEEIGNPIYPPVKKILNQLNIDTSAKKACQVTQAMMDEAEYIIVMDDNNLRNLRYMFNKLDTTKIYKMLNFVDSNEDVADPWYSRDFKLCYEQINTACLALIDYIKNHDLNTKS